MHKCLIILGFVALTAAANHERNDVIYDDSYDDLAVPIPSDSGESPEVEPIRQKRQVDRAPFNWMGPRFLHATCRLNPVTGSYVQGHLYLFQKMPWDYVKVKGSIWGMIEPKERFEVSFYANPPATAGSCDDVGDTLMEAAGVSGYLGQVKAKGYGRATGFSRGSRMVTLQKGQPASVAGRSIVVTSVLSRKRVACCAIQEQ